MCRRSTILLASTKALVALLIFALVNVPRGRAFSSPTTTLASRRVPRPLKVSLHSPDKTILNDRKQHSLRSRGNKNNLPTVEFIDPETGCEVVLLGCFHGTESSSQDVKEAITKETDVVVLELCDSRFTDLQREIPEDDKRPWMVAYMQMVAKTIHERGLPTGIAFAVLGGFSGIQTALSRITPGLEFSTAAAKARAFDCDIVLADQDVDETLRQLGSLPMISFKIATSEDRIDQWMLHQDTLKVAVMGDGGDLPQVQLASFFVRSPAAIIDLVQLTIPPTLFFMSALYALASFTNMELISEAYSDASTAPEMILHYIASTGIFLCGYLGFALPSVSVVITQRDHALTTGIRKACQQAGKGGRVVAILGFLHVNGIAKHMMAAD